MFCRWRTIYEFWWMKLKCFSFMSFFRNSNSALDKFNLISFYKLISIDLEDNCINNYYDKNWTKDVSKVWEFFYCSDNIALIFCAFTNY